MSKKAKKSTAIKEYGSPYKLSDKDTMSDYFERYKADGAGIIEMNGGQLLFIHRFVSSVVQDDMKNIPCFP